MHANYMKRERERVPPQTAKTCKQKERRIPNECDKRETWREEREMQCKRTKRRERDSHERENAVRLYVCIQVRESVQ